MKDESLFYVCVFVVFLLTLWLGWYTIVAVLIISIILAICLYYDDFKNSRGRKRRKTIGEIIFGAFVASAIGIAIVAGSMLFKGCFFGKKGPSYDTIERRTKIHTIDGDKMPTISDEGEYHNAGTGERQIEYGGSIEQKRDLEAADRLIESGH